ncbi:unnamed protein product, partial [Mesorhabditis spiculigera]
MLFRLDVIAILALRYLWLFIRPVTEQRRPNRADGKTAEQAMAEIRAAVASVGTRKTPEQALAELRAIADRYPAARNPGQPNQPGPSGLQNPPGPSGPHAPPVASAVKTPRDWIDHYYEKFEGGARMNKDDWAHLTRVSGHSQKQLESQMDLRKKLKRQMDYWPRSSLEREKLIEHVFGKYQGMANVPADEKSYLMRQTGMSPAVVG